MWIRGEQWLDGKNFFTMNKTALRIVYFLFLLD